MDWCPQQHSKFSFHRHTFALSRLVLPDLCLVASPSNERGRREDRVPAGTRGPLCESCMTKLHSGIQVKPKHPAFPAQWFYGLCRALPGERCTIAPVALRMADARTRLGRHITATLDAQTPGVRTTRFYRTPITPVVCANSSAHGCPPCEALRADVTSVHRRPARVRDDRDTPLFLGPG